MAQKISLGSQIAEVERELDWRRKNYPGRVSSRAMRDAEADLYITHLEAALASLRWLQKNRDAIEATRETNRALWDALRMIREAAETHAPVGTLPAVEHTGEAGLNPLQEAGALIAAIVAIATGKAASSD
jgi:hypothetical protein